MSAGSLSVFEAVRTMLAVRRYQDRPVPRDVLLRILEAGRLTGSSMNLQPWHFVVVEERDTLRRLGRLAPPGPPAAPPRLAHLHALDKRQFPLPDPGPRVQSRELPRW